MHKKNSKKNKYMIYLAKTDREEYSIHTFLANAKNLKSYLILVIVSEADQKFMVAQLHRSNIDGVNWLLATAEQFKALLEKYQNSLVNLIVMELTMTGSKSDVFCPHNWTMLSIDHEPKTAPFDDAIAKTMNDIVDQALFNLDNETKSHQKRVIQTLFDLMTSGMFHMQPDPKKVMGN